MYNTLLSSLIALLTGTTTVTTPQDFGAIANDGIDDSAAFEAMFLKGGENFVVPEGTYDFIGGNGVGVYLKGSINIEATGATFVSHGVDGDLFNLDAVQNHTNDNISIRWIGGHFNIIDQLNSKVTPWNTISGFETKKEGTANTADALSIRGNATSLTNGTTEPKVSSVYVSGISVTASNGGWLEAGGDGALYVEAGSALIENSTFNGIRDAAIYLSADGLNQGLGGNYTVRNVTVVNSAVGITSKRGADNILFENNTVTDSGVALAIYRIHKGNHAQNVTIKDNIIKRAWAGIRVEESDNITITGNQIHGIDRHALEGITSAYRENFPAINLIEVTNSLEENNTITPLQK